MQHYRLQLAQLLLKGFGLLRRNLLSGNIDHAAKRKRTRIFPLVFTQPCSRHSNLLRLSRKLILTICKYLWLCATFHESHKRSNSNMSATQTQSEEIPLGLLPISAAAIGAQGSADGDTGGLNPQVIGTAPLDAASPKALSKTHTSLVITTVSTISFLNTLSSGLLTVCLPEIAKSVSLAPNLLLWPASVYALSLSCTLLLLGSVADVVGSRPIFITGTGLLALSTLAVSLSQTGLQLIIFRAIQGLAMSFCMPTSVSIITANFPSGQRRNIAFSLFGGGQPIGYALGLVLGGVFADSIGWRAGYYLSAGINALVFIASNFTLPKTSHQTNTHVEGLSTKQRLLHEIDWVGVLIASTCLALLSYVFANITLTTSTLRQPVNIALLTTALLLIPAFPLWMAHQQKSSKPTLIPNALWRRTEFTSICLAVCLTWAQFNAYSYFATLSFQNVGHVSALGTSLRFLPLVAAGLATNAVCGLVVHRLAAHHLLLVSCALSAVSPALMAAVVDPHAPYFHAAFAAMVLSPISSDVLFNVSNLVITNVFADETQALAGGVFATVSQLGNSLGLAVTSIVSGSVAAGRLEAGGNSGKEKDVLGAELAGYRAAFWTCFGAAVVSGVVGVLGLRKSGKVGLKRE